MSLVTKLVGLVVVTCLFSGSIVGIVAGWTSSDGLIIMVEGRALESADFVGHYLSRYLRGPEAAAEALASSPVASAALTAGNVAESTAEVEQLLRITPHLSEVILQSTTGPILMAAGAATRIEPPSAGAAPPEGRQGWSPAMTSEVTGRLVSNYRLPIADRQGRVLGSVTVGVSLEALCTDLEAFNAGPAKVRVYDLRGSGTLLCDPDRRLIGTPAPMADPLVATLMSGLRDFLVYSVDGALAIGAVTTVEGLPWGVKMSRSRVDATEEAPPTVLLRRVVLSTAIASLVAAAVGAWLTMRFIGSLRQLHRAVTAVGAGDLQRRAGLNSDDEIGALAQAFDQMASSLSDQMAELRRSRQLIVLAEERQRHDIAEFLHSRVQTRLMVAVHQIAEAERTQEREPEHARSLLERARLQIEQVREQDIRLVSHVLHPSIIGAGLLPALESLQDEVANALNVVLNVDDAVADLEGPSGNRLPEELRLAAYRVVQEALGNATRHAAASEVAVSLRLEAGDAGAEELVVEVADNGRGFDPSTLHAGLGLGSIATRAGQFGGSWHISSPPTGGTVLVVRFPLPTLSQDQDTDTSPVGAERLTHR